ncbi:MAG: cytochrome c [Chromatiales bacterium]|jgi:cytochrome c556|nr:cytochrome c [Chromatiales bacterium]
MRRSTPAALLILATMAFAANSIAATAPADAIKYRKAVMSAMAAHTGAFSLINFGRVEHRDHLLAHVDALAALGTQIKVLFPAGTETGDTDALPLIWQEQEKFAQLLKASEKSTAELRTAVAAGDKAATMQAFKAVGESCKGCHDRYREKDD